MRRWGKAAGSVCDRLEFMQRGAMRAFQRIQFEGTQWARHIAFSDRQNCRQQACGCILAFTRKKRKESPGQSSEHSLLSRDSYIHKVNMLQNFRDRSRPSFAYQSKHTVTPGKKKCLRDSAAALSIQLSAMIKGNFSCRESRNALRRMRKDCMQ